MSELLADAIQIETLIPLIERALFRVDPEDPIGDLPIAQLRLMRALEGRRVTVSDLATELHMSLSATSHLVHRLSGAGLSVVVGDEVDRRSRRVLLTTRGDGYMKRRRALRVEAASEVLGRIPAGHRTRLLASLTELLAACDTTSAAQPHLDLGALNSKPRF